MTKKLIVPIVITTVAPAVTDDRAHGMHVGFRWLNTTGPAEYVCTDDSIGAAVWSSAGGGGGGAISVTDGTTTVNPATSISLTGAVVTSPGGGVAAIAISAGGTIRPFSPYDWSIINASGLPASLSGNYTVGMRFYPTRQIKITGIRFYWPAGGHTVTVKLWSTTDGSAVASQTVVTSGAGEYTGVFSSAYTVPANRVNDEFYVSIYDAAGGVYVKSAVANFKAGQDFAYIFSQPGLVYLAASQVYFAPGDAKPSTATSTERYICEPVVDITV